MRDRSTGCHAVHLLDEQVGPECFADPIAVLSKDILEAAAPVDGIDRTAPI